MTIIKFDTQRTNACDIQTLHKINIEATDLGKTRSLSNQDKQIRLMQSKVKHSAQLDKSEINL